MSTCERNSMSGTLCVNLNKLHPSLNALRMIQKLNLTKKQESLELEMVISTLGSPGG